MKLAIIVPCYNEQDVIEETTRRLTDLVDRMIADKRLDDCGLVFVDDGSKDDTWRLIEESQGKNKYVHGIKLAHNCGQQNAVWAGLQHVVDKYDAAISIDADLQDDLQAVVEMVDKFNNEQCDVVYGVRKERKNDTFFKRTTAVAFYKLMLKMGVDIVYNHSEFRLLSRRVIEALLQYPERNLFMRGIVPMIGFKSDNVYYDRVERLAGKSKYSWGKLFMLAINGITSFSIKPLRLITSIGVIIMFLSLCAGIYAFVSYFCGVAIQGWTSLLLSVWFLGGVQLFCVGVLGEYIGKIYKEVKHRPRYHVEKII